MSRKPNLFKRVFLPVLIIFLLTAFGLRLAYDREFSGMFDPGFWKQLWRMGQVMEMTHQNYLYADKAGYDKLADSALDHMLDSLDRYSEFFPKQDYTDFNNQSGQVIVGIGIEFERRNGQIQIVHVTPNGPADKAGWKPNDRIDAINGNSTADLGELNVTDLLRGPADTTVQVTHDRPGLEGFTRVETLTRGGFDVPSLRDAETRPDNIRYMRFTQFGKNTGKEFSDDLRGQDLRGLIIDFRDNRGGLLDVTTEFLEALLPANTLVVSTRGRKGVPDEVYKTKGDGDVHFNGPVVVLVNENTASAAEIVAGALQDYHRAAILGTRTYGKGVVQTVVGLRDGTGLKLTTQAYYLPGNSPAGRSIQDIGITPDFVLTQTDDERDIQRLEHADLRYIKEGKAEGAYKQFAAEDIFTQNYGFAPVSDSQVEAAAALICAVKPDYVK